MPEKILRIGDGISNLYAPNGTDRTHYLHNWVPQWEEKEVIEIHHLQTRVFWNYGVSASEGIQYMVIDRPFDPHVVAPVAVGSWDYIERYGDVMLEYGIDQWVNASSGGYNFRQMDVWNTPFPIPHRCMAVSLVLRPKTEGCIQQMYTKINYKRVKLTSSEWELMLLKNKWLIQARQPVNTDGCMNLVPGFP
jgi:hypothetical protein